AGDVVAIGGQNGVSARLASSDCVGGIAGPPLRPPRRGLGLTIDNPQKKLTAAAEGAPGLGARARPRKGEGVRRRAAACAQDRGPYPAGETLGSTTAEFFAMRGASLGEAGAGRPPRRSWPSCLRLGHDRGAAGQPLWGGWRESLA